MKNKEKIIGLLNFEGDVLKLKKVDDNEFVIYDQWDSIVEILTFDELSDFFDGNRTLIDSESNKWNWANQHHNAKVRFKKLFNYLK
jgi:hypothetical protein